MNDSRAAGESAEDSELARVLESYLLAIEAGAAPPRAELLAAHPHLANRLEACLASLDFLEVAGDQVRSEVAEATSSQREPAAVDASVRKHTELGDFRIVREIGRGGMGVVYEAEQLSLARRVAVKVLPFAAMLDERQLARFKNEARAAAGLHHPHIVPVHYVGSERGVHFYAMQYIEGQSLAEITAAAASAASHPAPRPRRGRRTNASTHSNALPPSDPHDAEENGADTRTLATLPTLPDRSPAHFRRIAELGIQAAEALHYAHESGVIHRDIKPSNLLVDDTGHLWVADFGLARIGADPGLTMTGDLVGTLRYMSPEQVRGKSAMADHRTDVYSLGVTLYELLARRPAFTGDDNDQLLQQVLGANPPPPRTFNRSIPVDLETIVLKAINKDAADRFATAQEMADDLRRFCEGQPIRARRPTMSQRAAVWIRRNPQLSLVLGIASVIVSLTICLAAWTIDSARRESAFYHAAAQHRAQLQRDAEAHVREHDYARGIQLAVVAWQVNNLERAQQALNELTPRPGEPDLRGFEWRYLSNVCQRSSKPFGRHKGDAYAASFSPDETLLATAGSDGVRIWSWPSRTAVTHLREAAADVDGIAWSPDGAQLVSFSEDWHVRVYRTSDWSLERSLRFDGALVNGCFTPDGTRLLVAERRQSVGGGPDLGQNVVHVYDAAGWESRGTLTGPTQINHAVAVSSDGQFAAAVAEDAAYVWDLSTQQLLHKLPTKTAHAVAFARHAPLMAVAMQSAIHIYDIPQGKLLHTLPSDDAFEGIEFGDDDRMLVAVGRLGAAEVWRQSPGGAWHLAHSFSHGHPLWSAQLDRNGWLVTTDDAGDVWAWNSKAALDQCRVLVAPHYVERWLKAVTSDEPPIEEYSALAERWRHVDPPPKEGAATAIAWSPDRREVAVVNNLGVLTFWDPKFQGPIGKLATSVWGGCPIAWSRDGRWIAVSGINRLALIERKPLRQVTKIVLENWVAPLVTFSDDGSTLFAARRSSWPSVSNAPCMKALTIPSLEEQPSRVPVAWRGSGDVGVTTSDDLAFLLDESRSRVVADAVSEIAARRASIAAFSQDRQTAALVEPEGLVVRRTSAWQPRVDIARSMRMGYQLALTPDGRTLAILADGQVSLWNTATGQHLLTLDPKLEASTIRFSPDGSQLVAAGNGPLGSEEVVVWDATPSVALEAPADSPK